MGLSSSSSLISVTRVFDCINSIVYHSRSFEVRSWELCKGKNVGVKCGLYFKQLFRKVSQPERGPTEREKCSWKAFSLAPLYISQFDYIGGRLADRLVTMLRALRSIFLHHFYIHSILGLTCLKSSISKIPCAFGHLVLSSGRILDTFPNYFYYRNTIPLQYSRL